MKRKLIYIYIVFLIIIVLILFIFYKNYLVIKMCYINVFNDMKVMVFNEIVEVVYCIKYIIDNFDKDGFFMENILYLKFKVKFVFLVIDVFMFVCIDFFEIDNYGIKLILMYNIFFFFDRFLIKVIEYIKDGGKFFNLFDNNDNKFLIKIKKDIYNEFLLYYDFFLKLDLYVIKFFIGIELFNKIIKIWDIEKVNKIVYFFERN